MFLYTHVVVVIHLGDSSADKLSTVITAELRRYLNCNPI